MSVKMIDVHSKEAIYREATAEGEIHLSRKTVELIREGKVEKGDPIQISTLAGIQASKITPFIIPLCHPLRIENTRINFVVEDWGLKVTATVIASEKTGVEMEALTAAMVALLNIWDVAKMYEKDENGQYPNTIIQNVRVVRKVKR